MVWMSAAETYGDLLVGRREFAWEVAVGMRGKGLPEAMGGAVRGTAMPRPLKVPGESNTVGRA